MKLLRTLLVGAALALCASFVAHAETWTEDYNGALAQAKASHKLILVDFTGSDWCPWCVKTDKEIFATQAFKDYADKNLILVKLDFLRNHPQDTAIKTRNKALADKYQVQGFPTLIAIDANEKVIFTQVGFPETVQNLLGQFPATKS
jgi:protein disulfide-isomerase